MQLASAGAAGATLPLGSRRPARRRRSVAGTALALLLGASTLPLADAALDALLAEPAPAGAADATVDSLDDLPAADAASIRAQAAAAQYFVRPGGSLAHPDLGSDALVLANPAGGFDATLTTDLVRLAATGTTAAVDLATAGLPASGPAIHSDTTVSIPRGPVTEWFRNDPGGLEQGWTVSEPLAAGLLTLDLNVAGAAVALDGEDAALLTPAAGGAPISYAGLRAFDATGAELPAHLEVATAGLRIVVDDAGATYPVVVDPVITAQPFLGPEPNGSDDRFGEDVDVDGRYLVVGAIYDQVAVDRIRDGSVSVFFDTTGNGTWELVEVLSAPNIGNPAGTFQPQIGWQVAVDVEPEGVTVASGIPTGALNEGRVLVWTFPGDPDTAAHLAEPVLTQTIVEQPSPYSTAGFGSSIDLDDGLLAIGMPNANNAGLAQPDGPDEGTALDGYVERIGLVEVHRRSGPAGTPFVYEATIHPEGGLPEPREDRDARQEFGTSVAVDAGLGLVAVGAIGDDGVQTPTAGTPVDPQPGGASTNDGAVWLFRHDGAAWQRSLRVTAPAPVVGGMFGWEVDLADDGDLLVGAPGPVNTGTGHAYLFDYSHDGGTGADVLTFVAEFDNAIAGLPAANQLNARFGYDVAFGGGGGEEVLVGSALQWVPNPSGTGLLSTTGAVFHFHRGGTGAGDLPVLVRHLTDLTGFRSSQGAQFGYAVAADEDDLVAGSNVWSPERFTQPRRGAAFAFRLAGGDYGDAVARLTSPDDTFLPASFGEVVAQDGPLLVVGAPDDARARAELGDRGSLWLFRHGPDGWQFERMLEAPGMQNPHSLGRFPTSLAIRRRLDAGGNETALWIAAGAAEDQYVDLDGSSGAQPQLIGPATGSVAFWWRNGGPSQEVFNPGLRLWSGSQTGSTGSPAPLGTPSAGGRFGQSVAFSSDGTLLVGEPGYDGPGGETGAIHRFEFITSSLTPQHSGVIVGDAGERLGAAVDADGANIAALGADASSPTARLYRDLAATGPLTAAATVPLPAAGTTDPHRVDIDLAGERVATGFPDEGRAFVHRVPGLTGTPVLEADLAGDAGSGFGTQVELSHGAGAPLALAVGAPLGGPAGTGEVRLFAAAVDGAGDGVWSPAATHLPPVHGDADEYGAAISLWPGYGGLQIADPGLDAAGTDTGRIYSQPVFYREQLLVPGTALEADAFFGIDSVLAGDLLFVGANGDGSTADGGYAGAVHVFRRVGTTWVWQERIVGPPDTGEQWFGTKLAFEDGQLFVGTPFGDPPGGQADAGTIEVYESSGGGHDWQRVETIAPPDGVAGDAFAVFFAVEGTHLWAGAGEREVGSATDAGRMSAFERIGGSWTFVQSMDNPFEQHLGYFGTAEPALDGDTAVLSNYNAPLDDIADPNNLRLDQGELYVLTWDGNQWNQVQTISNPDTAAFDREFGWGVALHEGRLLVAEVDHIDPEGPPGGSHGRVHSYRWNGSAFDHESAFVHPEPKPAGEAFGTFGHEVKFSDDGSPVVLARPQGTSAAYLYDPATGAVRHTVAAPSGGEFQNLDVGAGDRIVLSEIGFAGDHTGAVTVFEPITIPPTPAPPARAFVDVALAADTVVAGVDAIPTTGLPPSLLTNDSQQGGSIAATGIGRLDLTRPPFGTSISASPLQSVPLQSVGIDALPEAAKQILAVPLQSVPLQSVAGGWEAALVGTALEGAPLQSVTLLDVLAHPTALAHVTIGDLAASPLQSVALAAVALGTVPLQSVPLDPASAEPPLRQWCDALEAAGADTLSLGLACANLGAPQNAAATILSIALLGAPLQSVPLQSVPLQSVDLAGTPLQSVPLQSVDLAATPLQSVPLQSVPLQSVPLQSVPLQSVPLQSVPLQSVPLQSVLLGSTPLQSVPLQSVDLAGTPLQSVPLQSVPLQSVPLQSVPLQSVPLQSVPLQSVPLQSVLLGSTPLQSVPLQSVDLAGTPLQSVPLQSVPLQSVPLQSVPLQSVPLQSVPLQSVTLQSVLLGSTPLQSVTLEALRDPGGALRASAIAAIRILDLAPARRDAVVDCDRIVCTDAAATLGQAARTGALRTTATFGDLDGALGRVRLGDIAGVLDGATIDDVRQGLAGLTLADLDGFADLTLGELPQIHQYLTLGDVADLAEGARLGHLADRIAGSTAADLVAALAGLTLADLDGFADLTVGELPQIHQYLTIGDLVLASESLRLGHLVDRIDDGAGGSYDDAELRAALGAVLGPNPQLGHLGPDFGDLTLGELGSYGTTTLGQLVDAILQHDPSALDGITIGDLLAALVARSRYPWERLDYARVTAQALDEVDDGVTVTVAFQARSFDGANRAVRVEVRPPFGSTAVPGSVTLSAAVDAEDLVPEERDGTLVWTFDALPAPALHTLRFTLEPTLTIGPSQVQALVSVVDDDTIAFDAADLTVVEALEPNDTLAGATPLAPDTIRLSHVSSAGDLDVYRFTAAAGGASMILSNLDADLDLSLYGPPASSASIQDLSPRSIIPVEDEERSAIPGAAVVPPEPVDDLLAPSDLGDFPGYGLLRASINRGARDERIDISGLRAGADYYLVVSGYNGATSSNPYAVRLALTPPASTLACSARLVPGGSPGGTLPAALPAGTDTVFLVNRSRLAGLYGEAPAQAVVAAVDALVAYLDGAAGDHVGVQATALHVDADPAVALAYQAWDAAPCSIDAANAVVGSIVDVLDTYRDAGVTLRHVVVVGGDDAIPMARVPDRTEIANERDYASTFSDGDNALAAVFATGHVQTDDAYGDLDPYAFGDRALFVTDTAVGRLVEEPAQIVDQLEDFVAAGGLLDVGTALVTGYDFLSDGSDAVAVALGGTVTGTVDTSLVSETWTRDDLEAAIDAIEPALASINAHFDHFRALPADQHSAHVEDDLFTAAAVRGELAGDLARSIVFSMGCHGGLNASNLLVGGDRALDFAEAVAEQGGIFVGNTGYGYGDTELVALSERLMTLFARRLDGALSVGEALAYAKAEYAGDLTAYGVYDEKALMEATFYGLPFYRLDVADPPPPPPAPPTPTVHPDPIAGIDTGTIEVTPVHEERNDPTTGETYFVTDDPGTDEEQTTAVHDRPVQPRSEETFTAPQGTEAHDALVTALTSTDLHGVEPHILQPIVDHGDERVDVSANVVFPSAPVRVNPHLTPSGQAFTASITTGYFRTTATDGTGIQRLFDELTITPYFVPEGDTDFARPTFQVVDAAVDDGLLSFSVSVVDDDDGDVRRVLVLVAEDPAAGEPTVWQPLDLVRSPDTDRWTGSLPVDGEEIEYLVQAVDASGNVGITTNKALNFRDAATPLELPDERLTIELDGTIGNAGWFVSPVEVTVDGGGENDTITVELVGGTGAELYTGPFTVSGDGPHTVRARAGDGRQAVRSFRIDTAGPAAVITAPADGSVVGLSSGSTAGFSCPDAGSGATTCTATLDGDAVAVGTDVTLEPGTHTLAVAAGPDVAGNAPSVPTASATFRVVGPPVIDSIEAPNGVLQAGQPVTVTAHYTADPAGSPYRAIVNWDDGSSSTCASDGSTPGCTVTPPNAAGQGTVTAVHTYASATGQRTVSVTVANRFDGAAVRSITLNRTSAMTATPIVLRLRLLGGIVIETGAISATLTDADGEPLAGRTISFHAAAGQICTATTDSSGHARCTSLSAALLALLSLHYEARFAGDQYYRPITATAPIVKLR